MQDEAASTGDAPVPKTGERVSAWWRHRRLGLRSLPSDARRIALVALAMCVVASALIVSIGLGWHPPLGQQPAIQRATLPRLATIFCYLGLGVAAAVMCAAAERPGWRMRRLTFLSIATVGASLAAGTIAAGPILNDFPHAHPFVAQATGWLGMAAAAGLALLPDVAVARRLWFRPSLASLPFAMGLLGYVATTGPSLLLTTGAAFPRDEVAQPIVTVTAALGVGLAVLILWGTLQSARLGRDLSHGAVTLVRRSPRLVGWLLIGSVAGKSLFIVLGYANALPHALGHATFDESLRNGPVAWTLAAAFAGIAALWLLRVPKEPISVESYSTPAWLVVVGFTALILAATAMYLGVFIALLFPTIGPARTLASWGTWLLGYRPELWGVVATVALATFAGLRLRRFPQRRSESVFLLVVGAWSLPRALTVATKLATGHSPFSNITLVTMDTAITVTVAVLTILWYTGRQRAASPEVLLFVLLVSTLIARPGFILPTGWKVGALFYLALVFPVAYQFLFTSTSLNRPGADHPTRVLGQTGLSCALLTIALLQVAAGLAQPGGIDPLTLALRDLGRVYLLAPLGAFLVIAAVSVWRTGDDGAPEL